MNDDPEEDHFLAYLFAAFAFVAIILCAGCTADGSFDGQAFGAAVNAVDTTYRTYEEQQRLNAPQTESP